MASHRRRNCRAPVSFMHEEARDVLPRVLDAIGFRRGLLVGHSDGASIAAIYAGSIQDHRVRGLALMAPHFFTEDMGIAEIARAKAAFEQGDLRAKLARLHADRRQRVLQLVRPLARSRVPQVGHERCARPYPRADPDRAGRGRPVRHRAADRGGASRNAIARSRSRCCRIPATRPIAKRRRRRLRAIAEFANRLLRDHHEGDLAAHAARMMS